MEENREIAPAEIEQCKAALGGLYAYKVDERMARPLQGANISQEEFEVVRSVEDYGARIAASEPVLRILMATDALFLSLYAGFFVVLVGVHKEGAITWAVSRATPGACSWK